MKRQYHQDGTKVRYEWEDAWDIRSKVKEVPSVVWNLLEYDKAEHLLHYLKNARGLTLEVGCGVATLSSTLAQNGFKTICLDSSRKPIKFASDLYREKKIDHFYGVVGDGFNLPFGDATFEGIISTGLLEHFVDPIPLMQEMYRVLKPRGFFYADILPKKRWRLLMLFDFVIPLLGRRVIPLFEMPFSKRDIESFAEKIGLKDCVVFPAGIFLPRLPVLRKSRVLIGLENIANRLFHYIFKKMDATIWAEIFGVYYFVFGRK